MIPVIPNFILKTDQPTVPEVKLFAALEQAHIQQFKAGAFIQSKGKYLVSYWRLWHSEITHSRREP